MILDFIADFKNNVWDDLPGEAKWALAVPTLIGGICLLPEAIAAEVGTAVVVTAFTVVAANLASDAYNTARGERCEN